MRYDHGRLLFSATDLSRHLSCDHLTSLRRAVARGEIAAPRPYDDPRGDVLRQRGIEHERRLRERFEAEGLSVEEIVPEDATWAERAGAVERTRDAMRRGVHVIYQGRLADADGRWSGYPDFLVRVEAPSALGGWSYEVLDAKLARHARGEALLQLLLYSDLLTREQGREPEWMHLALGGSGEAPADGVGGGGRDDGDAARPRDGDGLRAGDTERGRLDGGEAEPADDGLRASDTRRDDRDGGEAGLPQAGDGLGAGDTRPGGRDGAGAARPGGGAAAGDEDGAAGRAGGLLGETARFRVVEYAAYYRAVRRRFEAHAEAPPETYPEPVEHCTLCDWKKACAERRHDDDHLSLVAGITRGQRRRLVEQGVETMAGLAALDPQVRLDGVDKSALARVREQARVQDQGRREGRLIHEEIEPVEPDKGLAALPEPSAGDIFFDLEGDAMAGDGGREYLFGFVDRDGAYDGVWALDAEHEKRAFERFVDYVMARREEHPDLHIYHYGAYETGAVKRLMGRYATREEQVDELLRGDVFVNLLRVVRQGLRASVERYSIKMMEPFYRFERDVPLGDSVQALVRFEAALESGAPGEGTDELRAVIEGYNRDDCLSTLRLAEWLETRRDALAATGTPVPRPTPPDHKASEDAQEEATETAELFAALTAGLPVDEAELDDEQRARRLLAYLLEFHRREDKSMWWTFFDRCDFTDEEHIEHRATLGGLEYVGEVEQIKRSMVHRYRFPEQTHEIEVGDSPKNPATATSEVEEHKRGFCGSVHALDENARTIDLKRGVNTDVPHPTALVPLETVQNKVLRESLFRLGQEVAEGGFAADGGRRAAFDLLRRMPPGAGTLPPAPAASGAGRAAPDARGETSDSAHPAPREPLVRPGEEPLAAVRRLAPRLDGAVLPVQGPPGCGKTYTGAHMVLDLLRAGQKVGVTANSHKVISNLLGAICRAADAPGAGVAVRGIQKAGFGDGCPDRRITQAKNNEGVAEALAEGAANLFAGSAWLWSREEMADAVDVLVVDEAGQMSLANTLAVCPAARSLVLLGDPRQLDQPIKGIHPPGADVSALGHLLGGAATVDPACGVFLDDTWRMHPALCAFTTEQFYEGRLGTRPDLVRQTVLGPGPLAGRGLRFVPVEHAGNTNASEEEADRVTELLVELLDAGAAWVDREGVRKPLTLDDVLIVAPYNAQVDLLRKRLREGLPERLQERSEAGARVGTVDKFQGQEAPIVLFSMGTSSADEAPRGMDFLYNPHRLNVATSRARCVAAIVASPALLAPDCRTPQQMRLANPFCRFLELAERTPAPSD